MKSILCPACGSIYLEKDGQQFICQSCDVRFQPEPPPTQQPDTASGTSQTVIAVSEPTEVRFAKPTVKQGEVVNLAKSIFLQQEDIPEDFLIFSDFAAPTFTYLPTYFFDFQYQIHWTAEIGYDSTDSWTDSEGNTHTSTTTSWQFEKGSETGERTRFAIANRDLAEQARLSDNQPTMKDGVVDQENLNDAPENLPAFDLPFTDTYKTEHQAALENLAQEPPLTLPMKSGNCLQFISLMRLKSGWHRTI